jgi:hypothetical protein
MKAFLQFTVKTTKTFHGTSKRAFEIGPYMGCMIQAENQYILPKNPLLPGGTVDINYVTPGAWFQDSEGFDSKKYGKASHKRNLLLCLY